MVQPRRMNGRSVCGEIASLSIQQGICFNPQQKKNTHIPFSKKNTHILENGGSDGPPFKTRVADPPLRGAESSSGIAFSAASSSPCSEAVVARQWQANFSKSSFSVLGLRVPPVPPLRVGELEVSCYLPWWVFWRPLWFSPVKTTKREQKMRHPHPGWWVGWKSRVFQVKPQKGGGGFRYFPVKTIEQGKWRQPHPWWLVTQRLLASAFNGRPDPEALDTPEVVGGLKNQVV